VVFGVSVALVACVALAGLLLRSARGWLEPRASVARGLAIVLCALALIGSVPRGRWTAFLFLTPPLLDNLRESQRIYFSVQRRLGRSPYRGYQALALRRKPDVYLVFVESYGRVIAEHPWLRSGYARRIEEMQRALDAAGWHAASAYTRAPIMGGRSWLAEGSVLTGMPLAYEAVFRQVIEQIERVPNLVSFLRGQGYATLLLAPSDRKRTGVENVNYYHYQRCVRFDDLHYRGPHVGWGIVPDQYSLFYTRENVLRGTPRPMYFEYHMVSSHAPWDELPKLVPDFHALGQGGEPIDDSGSLELPRRLRRYVHWDRRFAYLGELYAGMAVSYGQAISYELDVLQRFLLELPGDALVVVLGDHQPPFLAAETQSFDTPVHVLSRDPALLEELRDHGFVDGLWLGDTTATAVRHEGLFSLLVRALVRCCAQGTPLPPYLVYGADLGS
ncbi:MAG: sulfatase-like hydrolase/transferase, partial [Polyangiales bacterium]